jgi:two-component system chemotaxis sensor kinase CheA
VNPDPLRYFRVEARELVDQISAGVLELDQQPGPEPVARLLRFAHTLKGAARVVRQQDIADRAHAFEEVLVPHRAGTGQLPVDEIRALLRLNDEIEAQVSALEPGAEPAPATPEADAPATVGTITAGHTPEDARAPGPAATRPGPRDTDPARPGGVPFGPGQLDPDLKPGEVGPGQVHPDQPGFAPEPTGSAPAAPGTGTATQPGAATSPGVATSETPAGRTPTSDVDELLDAVGEAHARFAPLRSGTVALERLRRSAESLADQLRPPGRVAGRPEHGYPDPGRPDPARPEAAAASNAARSAAVRLASELSVLGRRLTDTVEQVERELDEVRGRAERLRLVAASGIFTALHRAVRDAADAQGKRVVFAGQGGDLRMDPQVLAQASSALLHVVRNAVAHGIENTAERLAAGKPAEGRIVVEVERRRRYAAFRCSDDGRGFDLDAVRRTAEARGLLPPGGATDQQALVDLVLRGGISTSTTVTEVAGRGIGLDVARDVAEQLGGEVSVITAAGVGTTVELVVPLSLLSLHGLVVEAAGTVATVPLDSVRTCVRLLPAQAAAATAGGRLAYDGQAVPFLPLTRALDGTGVPAAGDGLGTGGATSGGAVAVVVAADGDLVAIGVDRLAGTSTLVVRPLPDLAPAVASVGGVSMDLDGNPRLVLDAQGLIAEAQRHNGTAGRPAPEPTVRRPILVVDDSLTTRMLERSILESAGYDVDLAASGEEGLEMARHRDYSLFLTDIDMPGIDGFTFVERTRADPALSGIPAILVSSRSSSDDRERGVAVGASAYVVKGEFDQEELLAHIRKLVPA